MTTAHTPGPWRTRDSLHENHGIVRTGTNMEVQIHDSVCAEADARLIAAAPELLEQLKQARQYVAKVAAEAISPVFANRRLRDMQLAIDKATGGAA